MYSLNLNALVKAGFESANTYFQGLSRNNLETDQNIPDVAKSALSQLTEEARESRPEEIKARKTFPSILNKFSNNEDVIINQEEFERLSLLKAPEFNGTYFDNDRNSQIQLGNFTFTEDGDSNNFMIHFQHELNTELYTATKIPLGPLTPKVRHEDLDPEDFLFI